MLLALVFNVHVNKRFKCMASAKYQGNAPPELRLEPCMIGSVMVPISIFWFAWSNGSDVNFSVSVIGTIPLGCGIILVLLSISNYLADAYTVFAPSALAASGVLGSLFGFAFPLFTNIMYKNLGIHWASSVPGFLALAFLPIPFVVFFYGANLRKRCTFACAANEAMARMRAAEIDHLRRVEIERAVISHSEVENAEKSGDDGSIVILPPPSDDSTYSLPQNIPTTSRLDSESDRFGTRRMDHPIHDSQRLSLLSRRHSMSLTEEWLWCWFSERVARDVEASL